MSEPYFWKRVEKTEDCWIWTGRRNAKGYGTIGEKGRRRVAHRWYWERERGVVPAGFELDHLCRNRACVNLDHLEVVTHAENMARGKWATATHCIHGHEFSEENTYYKADGRSCRTCRRLSRRRWKERKKALAHV